MFRLIVNKQFKNDKKELGSVKFDLEIVRMAVEGMKTSKMIKSDLIRCQPGPSREFEISDLSSSLAIGT
jgi:hypothetical protein